MKLSKNLLPVVLAFVCSLSLLTGCKTPSLEPGGAYAPTNALGQVLYSDTGLALADASYKLSYETVQGVLAFERNNREAIWAISPQVKHGLDKARPVIVDINQRWAKARHSYKANPTKAGLDTLQAILSELGRLLPVVQAQIAPVKATITTP